MCMFGCVWVIKDLCASLEPHSSSIPSVMAMQRPYPSTNVARNPRYLDLPSTRKLSFRPSFGFFPCGVEPRQTFHQAQQLTISASRKNKSGNAVDPNGCDGGSSLDAEKSEAAMPTAILIENRHPLFLD